MDISDNDYTTAQATYDMRRLRLKGLIERILPTHTYHSHLSLRRGVHSLLGRGQRAPHFVIDLAIVMGYINKWTVQHIQLGMTLQ
jgi:hypothetical protein